MDRRLKYIWAIFLLTLLLSNTVFAKINKTFIGGNAVGGKDVVELYTSKKIVPGKPQYKTDYDGAEWLFSSEENLNKFKADPKKFAPAYGGYCAWAVANGYTADVSLNTATVIDGVLYLNYNGEISKNWMKEKDKFIDLADKNWPSLRQKDN